MVKLESIIPPLSFAPPKFTLLITERDWREVVCDRGDFDEE